MRGRLETLRHNERGIVLVFVAVGFLGFFTVATLAIDIGMFMVARSQAQTSADAGALAGTVSLLFDNWDDRSAGGPAVQNAVVVARANAVIGQNVSVGPADVTFPTEERIRVDVFRDAEHDNPLQTMIGQYFGVATADMEATATAEVVPANVATCVKPWAVPDKWEEVTDPPWHPNDSTFDMFYENGPNKGDPLPDPDVYVPVTDNEFYTGYRPSPQGPDYGRQVVLKPGNPQQSISPSDFFPIALEGGTGGDWYRENIQGCWPGVAEIGEFTPIEPGNMVGPTAQGTDVLLMQDPNAFWNSATGEVVSNYSPSPRVVVIPVFDPEVFEVGRQTGRIDIQIANFVGFFIEDMVGNNVVGRIVSMAGLVRGDGEGEGAPEGSFLRAIRLVE